MSVENVRIFEQRDVAQIIDVIHRCLKEVNSKHFPENVINYMLEYFKPETILDSAGKNKLLVYDEKGKILGTAYINIEKKYIGNFFVDPNNLKSKIGTNLMIYIEKIAHENNIDEINLQSTPNAVDFYKKLGFKVGIEHNDPNFGSTYEMKKILIN